MRITTDSYLEFCERLAPEHIKYYKRDLLFEDGVWRNRLVTSCKNQKSRVVVIGHSDLPVDDNVADMVQKYTKCTSLFAVNCTSTREWCFPLPLGLTNYTTETNLHTIYGRQQELDMLEESSPDQRDNKIYYNVNISTNPSERQKCFQACLELGESVRFCSHEPTIEGRAKYLSDLRRSKFAVCPEGNGVDTHRLWECLYMGCIPIVKKNRAFDKMPHEFQDAVCWISEWSSEEIRKQIDTYLLKELSTLKESGPTLPCKEAIADLENTEGSNREDSSRREFLEVRYWLKMLIIAIQKG
jgi:hypothetical protein